MLQYEVVTCGVLWSGEVSGNLTTPTRGEHIRASAGNQTLGPLFYHSCDAGNQMPDQNGHRACPGPGSLARVCNQTRGYEGHNMPAQPTHEQDMI